MQLLLEAVEEHKELQQQWMAMQEVLLSLLLRLEEQEEGQLSPLFRQTCWMRPSLSNKRSKQQIWSVFNKNISRLHCSFFNTETHQHETHAQHANVIKNESSFICCEIS